MKSVDPTSLLLLADSDAWQLPAGKAAVHLVLAGGIGMATLAGVFLPSRTLRSYSAWIGTENPRVARVLCLIAAPLFLGYAIACGLSLAGIPVFN